MPRGRKYEKPATGMSSLIAIDTNILVYAHDSASPEKQKQAHELIQNLADPILLWQVAVEYLAVIYKWKNKGMQVDPRDAYAKVRELAALWPFHLPSVGMIDRCEELMSKYSLQYWDAMIVAACLDDDKCAYALQRRFAEIDVNRGYGRELV